MKGTRAADLIMKCLVTLLVAMMVGRADVEDFLYVFASPPGQRSEIHWVPVNSPQSARVLVEDLDQTEVLHRHRGELWWLTGDRPMVGDLAGQTGDHVSEFDVGGFSGMARQGDLFYWLNGRAIGSIHMQTGDGEMLVEGESRLLSLVVYEDRLYFDNGFAIESIRIDGADRRLLGSRDSRVDARRTSRGLAVHDGRLIGVNESSVNGKPFKQVDLESVRELIAVGIEWWLNRRRTTKQIVK